MTKITDWGTEFAAYLNERRTTPYAWGLNDCATLALKAIALQRGYEVEDVDRTPGWLGSARLMIRRGWETVADAMDEILGQRSPAESSEPGDIILFSSADEVHLAVRMGSEAVTPGLTGLVTVPRSQWLAAWKVE